MPEIHVSVFEASLNNPCDSGVGITEDKFNYNIQFSYYELRVFCNINVIFFHPHYFSKFVSSNDLDIS
jgi:hypothetical protein